MWAAGTITGAQVSAADEERSQYLTNGLYFLPQLVQYHKCQPPGVQYAAQHRTTKQLPQQQAFRAQIPRCQHSGQPAAVQQRQPREQHQLHRCLLCLQMISSILPSCPLFGLLALSPDIQRYNKYISDFKGHLDKS